MLQGPSYHAFNSDSMKWHYRSKTIVEYDSVTRRIKHSTVNLQLSCLSRVLKGLPDLDTSQDSPRRLVAQWCSWTSSYTQRDVCCADGDSVLGCQRLCLQGRVHICRVADLLRIPDATPIPDPSVVLRTPRQEEASGVTSYTLVRLHATMTIYKGVSSLFGFALRLTSNPVTFKRVTLPYAIQQVWASTEAVQYVALAPQTCWSLKLQATCMIPVSPGSGVMFTSVILVLQAAACICRHLCQHPWSTGHHRTGQE